MATTDDKRLEIHVFGAAKGESIVLRLPSGQWGVVDCYSGSLKDSSKNPVLKFLTDRGVDHLAFLCMTHPHDDHYRGMSHLLERWIILELKERTKLILKFLIFLLLILEDD